MKEPADDPCMIIVSNTHNTVHAKLYVHVCMHACVRLRLGRRCKRRSQDNSTAVQSLAASPATVISQNKDRM